jgi:biotin transport system substrate-specific component
MHSRRLSAPVLPALRASALPVKVAAVVCGVLLLTLSSYVEAPMYPAPMTMQTLAVGLVGAFLGPRLGTFTVIVWLSQAALGAPVLAGGAAGAHHFVGATAGYLFAFPVAAWVVGVLADRGWSGKRPIAAFSAMLIGHALCLSLGAAWLAVLLGPTEAFLGGVAPFLFGALLKSALGACVLALIARRAKRAA